MKQNKITQIGHQDLVKMNKKPITFHEFEKTIYYTEKKIVIPLLNIRLDKTDYFKNGIIQPIALHSKLYEIYEKNLNRLK